jgi:hypothetical protein
VDDDAYFVQYKGKDFARKLKEGKLKTQPRTPMHVLLYTRTGARLRQTFDRPEFELFQSKLSKLKPNLLVIISLMNYGVAAKTFWPGLATELASLSRFEVD